MVCGARFKGKWCCQWVSSALRFKLHGTQNAQDSNHKLHALENMKQTNAQGILKHFFYLEKDHISCLLGKRGHVAF